MARVSTHGKMDHTMKVHTRMISSMAKENISQQMLFSGRAFGNREKGTERVS